MEIEIEEPAIEERNEAKSGEAKVNNFQFNGFCVQNRHNDMNCNTIQPHSSTS